MEWGPGKYDHALTAAKELVGASNAILIIADGRNGPGFAAQLSPKFMIGVPEMLRQLADQIESDFQQLGRKSHLNS